MRMYKVISHYKDGKTRLPASIFFDWDFSLLTGDLLKRWEEYKKTPDYLGFDDADRVARRRMPEGFKLQEWVNNQQIGSPVTATRPTGDARRREQIVTYKFELKPGIEYFFTAKQIDGPLEDENAKPSTQSMFRQLERREIFDEKTSKKSIEGFIEIIAVDEETDLAKEPGATGEKVSEKNDYTKFTFSELQKAIKERGIRGKFGATKESMIETLKADDAARVV